MRLLLITIIFSVNKVIVGLNNGLAITPPMGWLAWERFRCVLNCEKFPDRCISEKLFKEMAERMVEDGWLDAGYQYINIDDCWLARTRDDQGRLAANPATFPNGIKHLADYMHLRGLKLGIYEDYGANTCAGFPGTQGHVEIDAKTFADWGIDLLKLDSCHSSVADKVLGYPLMSKALNNAGRHILFSCCWPIRKRGDPVALNSTQLSEVCNMWRNHRDIQDSWDSVLDVIEFWAVNQDDFVSAAGPGGWNDPDMLIAGDYSLSVSQSRVQFGMWAMFAAPLFMSNDLRNIDKEIVEILQNKAVIAVNQDPLGIQARRYLNQSQIQVWSRPLTHGDYAVAVMSSRTDGVPHKISFSLAKVGIKGKSMFFMHDLFESTHFSLHSTSEAFTVYVNPSGIKMYRASPLKV